MKLSKKSIYAIQLMLAIAKADENSIVTLREIAEKENLSLKYLEQIVSVLCKSGLVKSRRGSRGGYQLAMPAEKYTLGSIIRVIEGEVNPDSFDEEEPVLSFLKGLCNTVNDYMESVTITDLIEEEKINNSIFDYCI
jgi:Rrf2 family protein